MRLKDKVAIVTGASKGIGEAIALGFAREGAHVVLAARTADLLEGVAAKVREMDREALVVATDVTEEEQVKAMVDAAAAKFGRVDILVNNAGASMLNATSRTSIGLWNRLMAVNLTGPFLCIKHVWKPMEAGGGGSIINIGSTSGSHGYPLMAAYSASKWGLVGLTKSTDAEGGPVSIRVNVINLGKTAAGWRTSFIADKEPILDPEECVRLTVFLASDDSRHVHGQAIDLDHAPREIAPGKGRKSRAAAPE